MANEVHEESIFDYLSREMKRLRFLSDDLPFDFNCGFVGYFGYELKADCEGDAPHHSSMPDAAFIFADRLIAFDHYEKCTYLLCVTEPTSEDEGERWIRETSDRLESLPPLEPVDLAAITAGGSPAEFHLSRSHQQYLDDIQTHQGLPHRGRHLRGLPHQQGAHRHLARAAAALPDAALTSIPRRSPPTCASATSTVLSSSPERFLIDRPRPLDGGQADQGHLPARAGPGRGPAPGRGAAHRREEPAPRT